MKLLQYPADCHKKNWESIQRMCSQYNIVLEQTNDRERLNRCDYDILWLPMFWVSPDEMPSCKILMGPHHFTFPRGEICGPPNSEWSSRCVFTTLSPWVKELYYEFTESTTIPIAPLPFGVKEMPARNISECIYDCLLYTKHRDAIEIAFIESILVKKGMEFCKFSYGTYKEEDYQNALQKTKFVIWLGSHESQGFAFQECLARNIPILVCDATDLYKETFRYYEEYKGKKALKSTTASWWDERCGLRITSLQQFPFALCQMKHMFHTFQPQEFVRENLGDAVCMKRMLDALGA
jgi:hypothetical protein